jgi:thymidylate synthase
MKPALIEARDLNEAYYKLVAACHKDGVRYKITEGSNKGGERLELSFAAGIINFPHTRPLAPTMPMGVSPTTTDEKIEEYFVNYLMDPTLDKNTEYKYSLWINGKLYNQNYAFSKESQMEWCIRHFMRKGYGNNHCYITVGDPYINFNYDIPYRNETERKTSPCLRGIDLKIKDNKLILGVVYRSWDLYAGFPENMGGFAMLNAYIAEQLPDVAPGPLTFASQGLHLYDYQAKAVLEYLRKE